MSKRPWMPLYIGDYLAKTTHLRAAEHGAYLLLIMHYWMHGGIPSEERELARITKLTAFQWKRYRATLLAFFEVGADQKFRLHRVEKLLLHFAKISNDRKAAAMQMHLFKACKTDASATHLDLRKKERKLSSLPSTEPRAREEPEPPPEKQESGERRLGEAGERASGAGAPLALSPPHEQVAKKAKKRPSEYSLAELMEILDRETQRQGGAMTRPAGRKLGAMPEWAKTGPINRTNYNYRAEAHCARKSAEREGCHPTITRNSPEFGSWREYFETHLDGGKPFAFQMLLDGTTSEMTVPEQTPQRFDPSFAPKGRQAPTPYRPPLPQEPAGARANLFVPADNPHYAKLVERAAGEDAVWCKYGTGPQSGLPGIWVPLGWYDNAKGTP